MVALAMALRWLFPLSQQDSPVEGVRKFLKTLAVGPLDPTIPLPPEFGAARGWLWGLPFWGFWGIGWVMIFSGLGLWISQRWAVEVWQSISVGVYGSPIVASGWVLGMAALVAPLKWGWSAVWGLGVGLAIGSYWPLALVVWMLIVGQWLRLGLGLRCRWLCVDLGGVNGVRWGWMGIGVMLWPLWGPEVEVGVKSLTGWNLMNRWLVTGGLLALWALLDGLGAGVLALLWYRSVKFWKTHGPGPKA